MEWIKKGAEKNDLRSMSNLGWYYAQNEPVNLTEAFKWYKLAGDNGFAEAMGNLAFMYATGQGTVQNNAEALNWLNKGANLDDPQSMFNYGIFYIQGMAGLAQDPGLARQWLTRAAKAGHPNAKAALEELAKAGY